MGCGGEAMAATLANRTGCFAQRNGADLRKTKGVLAETRQPEPRRNAPVNGSIGVGLALNFAAAQPVTVVSRGNVGP